MESAIRTRELRKVYHSPPPMAAGRAPASGPGGKRGKDAGLAHLPLDRADESRVPSLLTVKLAVPGGRREGDARLADRDLAGLRHRRGQEKEKRSQSGKTHDSALR